MSKYIDAGKLIKSVNNYQEGAKAALNPTDGDADYYKGKIDACEDIQEFITSLQQEQPEVDLEEEVKKYFEGYWPGMKTPEACNHQMVFTTPAIMRMIEHFYELGLNARKEG